MSGPGNCGECRILCSKDNLYDESNREEVLDEYRLLVPNLGELGIQAAYDADRQLYKEFVEGAADCPGPRPINKFMRWATLFADGKAGLEYYESTYDACRNPIRKDPEFEKRRETSVQNVQNAWNARTVKRPKGNID